MENCDTFLIAKTRVKTTTGEVIRMLRELKGWSQRELAEYSGVGVTKINLLERDIVDIKKTQAAQISETFGIHPAIITFP